MNNLIKAGRFIYYLNWSSSRNSIPDLFDIHFLECPANEHQKQDALSYHFSGMCAELVGNNIDNGSFEIYHSQLEAFILVNVIFNDKLKEEINHLPITVENEERAIKTFFPILKKTLEFILSKWDQVLSVWNEFEKTHLINRALNSLN